LGKRTAAVSKPAPVITRRHAEPPLERPAEGIFARITYRPRHRPNVRALCGESPRRFSQPRLFHERRWRRVEPRLERPRELPDAEERARRQYFDREIRA